MLTLLALVAAATPHLTVSTKDIQLDGRVLVSPLPMDEYLNIPVVEQALRAARLDGGATGFELDVEPAVTFAVFKRVLFSMASAGSPAQSFQVGTAGPFALTQAMPGATPVVRVAATTESDAVLAGLKAARKDALIGFSVTDEVTMERLARLMRAVRSAGFADQYLMPATVGAPNSTVGLGGPVIGAGSLDKELIRKVIHANRGMVRGCYESALKDAPKLSGKVFIKFTISPTGEVSTAEVGNDEVHDASLSKCLVTSVKSWKFPEPKGGGVVIVTYPFVFATSATP